MAITIVRLFLLGWLFLILFRTRETLLDQLDVTATEICADVRDERVWGLIFPGIANLRQKQRNHPIENRNIDGQWASG